MLYFPLKIERVAELNIILPFDRYFFNVEEFDLSLLIIGKRNGKGDLIKMIAFAGGLCNSNGIRL